MKILIGVDSKGVYKPVVDLVSRLKFLDPSLILAHSVEAVAPIPVFTAAEAAFSVEANMVNDLSDATLAGAADLAHTHRLPCEKVSLVGNPGRALADFAERANVDLIAVQSERKHGLGSLFFGNVSRALTIFANESFLVSKGEVVPTSPLSAVFATDHSEYAAKAFELFLKFAPRGIKRVHIAASVHLSVGGDEYHPPTRDEIDTMEREYREKNADLHSRLLMAGYNVSSEVYGSEPNTAIAYAMSSTNADLLVMAAHGHGFVHRLFLGSVSLHQVVAESWPVLVLRP